ncbi:MAG: ATP-binding protein, partial [Planctomycetales bacterium]|nr:ATP-binding protein [Planctomycetales bacterium]
AAMNPCPCGYRNDPRRDCNCSVPQVERYMAKISGPLLDRIDIHLEVPSVDFQELTGVASGTSTEQMRTAVRDARRSQGERFANVQTRYNGQMKSREIREFCHLDDVSKGLVKASVNELGLSARAHDKILRVARTIADIDGSDVIRPEHVTEAINYRILDRQMWA